MEPLVIINRLQETYHNRFDNLAFVAFYRICTAKWISFLRCLRLKMFSTLRSGKKTGQCACKRGQAKRRINAKKALPTAKVSNAFSLYSDNFTRKPFEIYNKSVFQPAIILLSNKGLMGKIPSIHAGLQRS